LEPLKGLPGVLTACDLHGTYILKLFGEEFGEENLEQISDGRDFFLMTNTKSVRRLAAVLLTLPSTVFHADGKSFGVLPLER
jgi:hypothetical protein